MDGKMNVMLMESKKLGIEKSILSLLVEWKDFKSLLDSSTNSITSAETLNDQAQKSRQDNKNEGRSCNEVRNSHNPVNEKLKGFENVAEIGGNLTVTWESLISKENEMGKLQNLCEDKFKEMEGREREIEFSRKFIEERAKELELRQIQLDDGFRELQMKEKEFNEKMDKNEERAEELELRRKQLDDGFRELKLKEKEFAQKIDKFACANAESVKELELRHRQLDDGFRELELKELTKTTDKFACSNAGTPDCILSQDHDTQATEEVTFIQFQVGSSQILKDKRARTKNFTRQEDEMLISAWQNVSFNPVAGADQTSGTYWQRVHNYFMKYKDFQSNRTCGSLMHRWSLIQLTVNKFQSFYNQVGVRSGYSEDDKICSAKGMYKEIYKTNFSLEHCWKVLRNLPKWNANFVTKKSKQSQKDSPTAPPPCTPECVILGDSELERPIERKAAKEIEKKRKRSGCEHDDGGAANLEQMRVDQVESKKQRNEHMKEMIQLGKEKAERKKERDEREKIREIHEQQDEADAKIMAVDISSTGARN